MDFEEEDIRARGQKVAEKITVTSQCLSCGISYTENFPWYKENEFICPECGGEIDDQPIIEFAKQAFERLREMKKEQ